MLIKELTALRTSLTEADLPMSAEVVIVAGPHKGKHGYINKIMKTGGKVTGYEIENDDDDGEPAWFEVTPDQVKKTNADLDESYSESADFDADMEKIIGHINAVMTIMQSANWKQHIKDTTQNFDVDATAAEKVLWGAIRDAHDEAQNFYETMQEAA